MIHCLTSIEKTTPPATTANLHWYYQVEGVDLDEVAGAWRQVRGKLNSTAIKAKPSFATLAWPKHTFSCLLGQVPKNEHTH
jgi:hypothetical protein